jgi:hypothetical protein
LRFKESCQLNGRVTNDLASATGDISVDSNSFSRRSALGQASLLLGVNHLVIKKLHHQGHHSRCETTRVMRMNQDGYVHYAASEVPSCNNGVDASFQCWH